MPIYEYECLTCGATFEKRQSFSDAPIADCPNGHNDTRRLLSAPAIVFKGSGFYINDSKSSKSSVNGSGTNGHSENGSKVDKTEPKPETTAKAEKTASSDS